MERISLLVEQMSFKLREKDKTSKESDGDWWERERETMRCRRRTDVCYRWAEQW